MFRSLPDEPEPDHNLFEYSAANTEDLLYGDYIAYSTKVPNHSCTLPEAQDAIKDYIYSGCCVQLRRKFRRCLLVNAEEPESKARLKSCASIREEKERHLKHFYYMIHPFSSARIIWETLMIFIYMASFVVIGLHVVMSCHTPISLLYVESTLFIPLSIDIILWFYTGYFDEDKQYVVLESRKIIRRYLLGFFVTDFLSAVPLNTIIHFSSSKKSVYQRWNWIVNLIELIARLPRIITTDRYMKKSVKRHNMGGLVQNILTLGLILLILINWAAALLFTFKCKRPSFLRYVQSVITVVSRFMLVGLASEPRSGYIYLVVELVYLGIGCILSKFIIVKVTAIYSCRVSSEQKYWNLVRQVNEYMEYKLLPKHLKKKVFQFINFKFQKNVFKEDLILNTLSATLKREIVLHNCMSLVERVNFFKGIPLAIIERISCKLKSVIYLHNDVIIQAGSIGHVMYFIHTGTVAIYTNTNKEICHLHDGSHFGEISLVIRERRTATVIAITECELFRLSRKDFKDAIAPFPELASKIKSEAMARMENTLRIVGTTEHEINLKRGQWLSSKTNLVEDENN